jgi:omega-6 fatty acid desaturase (delta-12 desaturase)
MDQESRQKSQQKPPSSNPQSFDRNAAFGPYKKAHWGRSLWQLTNSLGLYALLWYAMYLSLDIHYALTLLLSLPAGLVLIRLFVILHDCVHGSYFPRPRANQWTGRFISLFVFTPFDYWRKDHLSHHASVCNLDHKGQGDVWTLSVKDYQQLNRLEKFFYRMSRHPVALFCVAPIFLRNRIPNKKCTAADKKSIYLTNVIVILLILLVSLVVGFKAFFMIQIPTFFWASAIGSWLFYVQHQFSQARWNRSDQWNHLDAAFKGTSYYALPRVLHWCTGNIGYHHIHHLCPRIPNYHLAPCYKNSKSLHNVATLTLRSSWDTLKNQLWDEQQKRFIAFKEAA